MQLPALPTLTHVDRPRYCPVRRTGSSRCYDGNTLCMLILNAVDFVNWPLAPDAFFQARREPQRGPGKHSRGPPNIFAGLLWGNISLHFFLFKMVHSGAFYISERRRGP